MINLETTSLIIFGFEIVDIFGFSFFLTSLLALSFASGVVGCDGII